jgi:hypothetical protein
MLVTDILVATAVQDALDETSRYPIRRREPRNKWSIVRNRKNLVAERPVFHRLDYSHTPIEEHDVTFLRARGVGAPHSRETIQK